MSGWYQSLRPRKVDVVGDFAGKELFVIHGDSMLLYCLGDKVDYDRGLQLLHAVYAVEAFLHKLKRRGCRFHIVWFEDDEDLCAPPSAEGPEPYLLTRSVLMNHFARHDEVSEDGKLSFQFSSMDCDEYEKYVKDNAIYFFLCLDGHSCFGAKGGYHTARYLGLVYRLGLRGYSVAFLDTLEFSSSKIFVSVASPSIVQWEGAFPQEKKPVTRTSFRKISDLEERENGKKCDFSLWGDGMPLSVRDVVSLTALCNILLEDSSAVTKRLVAACLVHLSIIRSSELSQRSLSATALKKLEQAKLNGFLSSFCRISRYALENDQSLSTMEWDAPDLIDGRMLRRVFLRLAVLRIPHSLITRLKIYANHLRSLTKVDISDDLPSHIAADTTVSGITTIEEPSSVQPFANAILECYLHDVRVEIADSPGLGITDRVFQDISHWHNANKSVDPKKHHANPKGFLARRKNQKYMADTIAYSASLTNSSGKLITPQTIVVMQPDDPKGKKGRGEKQAAKRQVVNSRNAHRAKGGQHVVTTGHIKTEQVKRDAKAEGAIVAWQSRCAEFEREKDLVRRFLKTTRYITGLAAMESEVVGAEASLHAINTLSRALSRRSDEEGMKPSVAEEFTVAANAVGLSTNFGLTQGRNKALPFLSVLSNRLPRIQTFMDPLEFQLQYCGPYLERGFDPKPDPRVRFTPDAWQRNVLDTIDADKSLLVIAPTSSGKTFISFYAMKKVLQTSDDGVLVYVAPTKALVNQIAAEIQAEFSKSYRHQAKSVWAIHTRDYRVNSPTGCQILVTVPHILEIMLLAPSNSVTHDSWAHRVKTIIFDEVHCIGQTDEGVIWEHLLLLAPCPIVALSATVGNVMEFKAWLEDTQKAKGFELEMVVHSSRYSDLRKFIYFPPKAYVFDGVQTGGRLPVPGLESIAANTDDECGSRFAFIHPIASLTNRNRGNLDDISLEPRDCLELWRCMVEHQTEPYPIGDSLNPRNFLVEVAKKADVVKWGAALKETLLQWMKDAESPFPAVQRALRSSVADAADTPTVHVAEDLMKLGLRFEDDAGNLASTALPLLVDLSRRGALPALLFNYDRGYCEKTALDVLRRLQDAEETWKAHSPEWAKKMEKYEAWKKDAARRSKSSKHKLKPETGSSKADMVREAASREADPMERFDPTAPISIFSFADESKLLPSELEKHINSLSYVSLKEELIQCLRRGIGVHHAGMNRVYRQVVEMLFRKGFLTVVVATGTLALGINMPCKTVVFLGDSVFLTALNYQQAAGRSGRRGFDQLGNVVFVGIKPERTYEIMSSRLPDLQGHFPLSTTMVLRLLSLLYHTGNGEYAVNAVKSMLSQTRLYLGGPSNQMAIKHHVRFSIEYLRRQNLLTREGAPLNFAGLIGHLYFTENAVFAFHTLLKEGYFYDVCRDIRRRPKDVLLELVLVLSHLFCRLPVRNYKDKDFLENVVHRSTSVVLLPKLPRRAEQILLEHNKETLGIFTTYVSTYIDQHLSGAPDDTLPFTGQKLKRHGDAECNVGSVLGCQAATKLRSPFVALSGFTDDFDSIHDLCNTVRSGVFLEESAIPYIPIYPKDTEDVPWNAYIYDFFKHGNMKALVNDNKIKGGDVWFHLKDFSLILATITASLQSYFNQGTMVDDVMMDVQGAGNDTDDESDEREEAVPAEPVVQEKATMHVVPRSKNNTAKAVVADSWEDEAEDSSEEGSSSSESRFEEENWGRSGGRIEDNNLMLVLTAFKKLQEEFDTKFKKVWA